MKVFFIYAIVLNILCNLFSTIAHASSCENVGIIYLDNNTGLPSGSTGVTTPPDQGFVDPVVNHKHAIGMHYVKYRMSDQNNWHDDTTTVSQGTDQNLHVRVKVKEKEGWEWNDIYVDLYYSENRWFSRSHDTLVATKHIKSLGKKEKESAYFNDIDISNLSIGHHYYFADIRYSRPGLSDHNISSRSDDTEYVVIDVQDPNKLPVGYIDTANCSQISGWADDVDTNSPLNIHIYDGSMMIDNIYADDYRSDLGKSRGFTFTVSEALKDGTTHNIRIFAINEPQGTNPLLTQGSFSFACGNNGAVPTTRFYNSRVDAHFYSVNPVDQTRVPAKYPDWANHGTSFNAFPVAQTGTVPLYTCWTGKTHDYVLDLNQIGQYAPCQEQPYRLFDVYSASGEGRIPVYLMYKESTDALILSNGEDDAYYLQNVHGYGFTSEDPFFWAPSTLISENAVVNTNDPVDATELAASVDEEERKTTEEVFMILLF